MRNLNATNSITLSARFVGYAPINVEQERGEGGREWATHRNFTS